MCARLLACPLCSQPGFLTLDALRVGLVSVATRPLVCPVCNEVLLGIDKLTIHLFGHTINLNNNAESSKHTASNEHLVAVHNAHNIALQDWNVLKAQQSGKTQTPSGNNRTCVEPSDIGVSNADNEISIGNSQVQDQDSPVKSASLTVDYNYDVIKVNIMPQSNENQDATLRSTTNLQQGVPRTNCALQYLCNDNMKHLNVLQENTETEKTIIPDLITATKTAETTNIFGNIEEECVESNNSRHVEKERLMTNLIEEESDLSNFQPIQNVMSVRADAPSEECNNEKSLFDAKGTALEANAENQDSKYTSVLSNAQACNNKVFRALAPKEKTERCNICGFHFSDTNILSLHKQLVHDQDSNGVLPGRAFKNFSCHLCSKIFKMRGSLMVHMRVAHIGHNTSKCMITNMYNFFT